MLRKHLRYLSELTLALALVACSSQGVVAQEAPSKAPMAKEAVDSQHLRSFLDTHCVRCHNAKKQSGKVALDQSPDVQLWQRVFTAVEGGEMPPADAKQPPAVERAVALRWMRQVLKSMGVALDESAIVAANRGNSVDHDALFGTGVGKSGASAPSTRARLWRLTPKAYENFLDEKIQQFQLDLPLCSQKPKEYGFGMPHLPQGQLKAPWSFTPQWDFTNYAQTLRVGESEVEIQLRNAKAMADAMLLKFQGKLRNGKPISPIKIKEGDQITQLDALMKAGKKATPDQVKSAVAEAFSKLLGREPDADEWTRYSAVIQKELEANGAEDAARQLLIAVLCTPRLVYRVETTGAGRGMLATLDVARAISFTLTDSEPDAALLQAAKENKLTTVEQVREQVVRILDDKAIVPVGDALVKLRAMIVAGKFPGVKRQSEIFPDAMPHLGGLGASLQAYCHFSAIYRIPPPAPAPLPEGADQAKKDAYAQQELLRQIAWETASKYPYAGIAKYEPSAPSNDEKKPAPTPAASAVPEALKGWKAAQDLPDDTVVTDYNEYIEKLPKAERPGVSNVKYYVDGNGQSGVAVLVFLDRVEWTHLLTYDKQNKRTAVKKFVSGK